MKHIIFKKNEDGTYGEKLGTYLGPKDDTSANRSYLQAEPMASHFEIDESIDEDCAVLVWIEEIIAVEAQPEMWIKDIDGIESVQYEQPMLEDENEEIIPDDSWTHVPEVVGIEGVAAHWQVQEDANLKAAKTAQAMEQMITARLDAAINFGQSIMKEFTIENMKMGITQDNMTGTVRKAMIQVISACQTGSLYDAMIEAKAIPEEDKDAKYITNERILSFVNKIEAFLELPLSETL